MQTVKYRFVMISALSLCLTPSTFAQRQMESLSRGGVGVKTSENEVFLSWRLLGDDRAPVAFNVYRQVGGNQPKLVNSEPLQGATNFIDRKADTSQPLTYLVKPVVDGKEGASSPPIALWQHNSLTIPIQAIEGYRPGDASLGDLDGDGEYELVLHQVDRPRDNSHSGLTGAPILDAYEFSGEYLWRINLGTNIREGEHYTQFVVYDLDGNGKAELACKTADGSIDGAGNVIGDPDKDWRTTDPESKSFGRILAGPEYFTIFDGEKGTALKTVDYIPGRDPIDGWGGIGGNGGNDSYGNRCDRFLACVAYLDGERPSVVMCRGVYGRTVLAAWDWRDGELTSRWVFDSGISYPPYRDASAYSGMGGHSLAVADVDRDGKDEIVYQAMVIGDDGTGLHSSGLRHGDAMHVTDMDPDREGLEIFTIQENEDRTVRFQTPGAALRDAETGEILWSHSPGADVKAGLAADIDPRYKGYELWGGPGGLRMVQGEQIGPAPRSTRFAIWWDGDLLRELLNGGTVTKWNWEQGREEVIERSGRRRGFRNPVLMGDLLGDWREEYLIVSRDGRSLELHTTTIPTEHRLVTLLHDPQYRLSLVWQNVAYNKPPHPGFYLGEGMQPPPRP
jgi:rhamnogalacturonan endolyase